MEVVLKHVGTTAWAKKKLKLYVKTCILQKYVFFLYVKKIYALSTHPGKLLGPAALCALIRLSGGECRGLAFVIS